MHHNARQSNTFYFTIYQEEYCFQITTKCYDLSVEAPSTNMFQSNWKKNKTRANQIPQTLDPSLPPTVTKLFHNTSQLANSSVLISFSLSTLSHSPSHTTPVEWFYTKPWKEMSLFLTTLKLFCCAKSLVKKVFVQIWNEIIHKQADLKSILI